MTDKVPCDKCGVMILPSTSSKTGGKCMPCYNGVVKREKVVPLLTVDVEGVDGYKITLAAPAPIVSEALVEVRHIGDSKHANYYELEAQKALVRHCLRYETAFKLHDDHWGRTGFMMIGLFEKGLASISSNEGAIEYGDVTRSEWREGTDPLGLHGGFSYELSSGKTIFKINTWVS